LSLTFPRRSALFSRVRSLCFKCAVLVRRCAVLCGAVRFYVRQTDQPAPTTNLCLPLYLPLLYRYTNHAFLFSRPLPSTLLRRQELLTGELLQLTGGQGMRQNHAVNAVTPQCCCCCCCCCRPPTRSRADSMTTQITGQASKQGQQEEDRQGGGRRR
jgi:hypothetical protein